MSYAMVARLERGDRVDVRLIPDVEYWRILANNEPILFGAAGMESNDLSRWSYRREIADDPLDEQWSRANGLYVFGTPHGPQIRRWTRRMPNHHSVTFDANSSGSTGTGTATSITVSHTVASQPNLYLAGFACLRQGQSVSSATYNAVACTSRVNHASPSTSRVQLYDLLNPATGAHNAVFNFSAATNGVAGWASAYGVNQTTGLRATGTGGASVATGSHNAEVSCNSAVGDLGISAICVEVSHASAPAITDVPDADWTQDYYVENFLAGANNRSGLGMHMAGASPTITRTDTLTVNTPSTADWCMVVASIQPSGNPWYAYAQQ